MYEWCFVTFCSAQCLRDLNVALVVPTPKYVLKHLRRPRNLFDTDSLELP